LLRLPARDKKAEGEGSEGSMNDEGSIQLLTAADLAVLPTLRHHDWDVIDGAIVSCVRAQWRKVTLVVSLVMQSLPEKYPHLSAPFYAERIRQLVGQGRLDAKGHPFTSESEVRLPEAIDLELPSSAAPFAAVARSRADWGLPEERFWERRLQFNARSSTIVLTLVLSRANIPYSRIYTRRLWEKRYRPVLHLESEDFSVEGPVLGEEPYLFFVLTRWVKGHPVTSAKYVGLGRLDLETHQHELWETDATGRERFFVSDLASADRAGRLLHAVIGIRPDKNTGAVKYALASIDWNLRAISKLGALDAGFF
jgi:hypothetical protein